MQLMENRGVITASAVYRRTGNGCGRYDATLQMPDGNARKIFFEIEGEFVPPPVQCEDFLVLAVLFYAMRQGYDLYIDGTVSRQLLINLEEFQRAWSLWLPKTYQPIRISARNEIDDFPAGNDRVAVVAFSGGVDATFALTRHVFDRKERDRCRVAAAVLVHGFDIPLAQEAGFQSANENAHAVAAELNVPLCTVRTNWRELVGGFWEYEFCAGLSTCLALFSEVANFAVMGSDEDYVNFVLPWGSNPITNHLLSSARFQNLTEGGAISRTEKVREIARFTGVADRLRVCWQGPCSGKNCGRCEKCIRTKLNFLANDLPIPASLGNMPGSLEIMRIQAPTAVQVSYLQDIYAHAKQSSMSAAMKTAVLAAIIKNRILNKSPFVRTVLRIATWPLRLAGSVGVGLSRRQTVG